MKKFMGKSIVIAAATVCSLTLMLSGCGGRGSGGKSADSSNSSNDIISVFNPEPANPLVPSSTNEISLLRPLEMLFSRLVRFDNEGKAHNEIAREIGPNAGMDRYTITIMGGWRFSDGSPVRAASFVRAWSWAANAANAQRAANFFSNIVGYDELQKQGVASDARLSGLRVVDDTTFTVDLVSPSSTFPIQVGYIAFAPLPESFYGDTKAFGQKPVTVGPYRFESWEHNKAIRVARDPNYRGGIKVKNAGIEFRSYTDAGAAYADVQSGNLDVLDTIPASARKTFQNDSTLQAVNTPGSVLQMFTIPTYMRHFGEDQEGRLRRQAVSMAIDRKQIIDKVLSGTGRVPTDFTAPTIPGHSRSLKGAGVLRYDAKRARDLWEQANRISPWNDDEVFKLAYSTDSGEKEVFDAIANSIKNTLGIKAEGNPFPTLSELRENIQSRKFTDSAFRSRWQPDYPSPESYLKSKFDSSAANGKGSNDGDYKNPEFDSLMAQAASANSADDANRLYQQAEEILLVDMPAIPLYYMNSSGVSAKNVNGFAFNWSGTPYYPDLQK